MSSSSKDYVAHRCSICNAVSEYNLSNSTSRHHSGAFHSDPDNSLFMVCSECYNEISETVGELNEAEDDVDPTQEFWDTITLDALQEGLKK